MKPTIIQIIQAMLVPGVMVSACGLLLLGMNNKYSLIVQRIRLLKKEERDICAAVEDSHSEARSESVSLQVPRLIARLKLVRSAVFSYSIGVAFFILSSLLIGLNLVHTSHMAEILIVLVFLSGMLSVLIGIILAAVEVRQGYTIVEIEAGTLINKR